MSLVGPILHGPPLLVVSDVRGLVGTSPYKKLANHGIEGVTESFAHLWNLKVMLSTQFYVWRALSDRITTKLNLHKRGLTLSETLCARKGRGIDFTHSCLM